MKLLITGACGHIGSYLVENIHKIRKIKKVVLIDNFNAHRYHTIFNLKNKSKFKFHQIDLSKKKLDKFEKVDVIIHCASHTNAQDSFSKKNEMYKNNISCMKNIISYCIKKKSKLIHISSSSVYGTSEKVMRENVKKILKPQSPYAKIKLIEEKLLRDNRHKMKYISLRFGTIAGVSKGMRFHTAINKFCLSVSLNQKIQVYKTAINQYRPYLSLKDAFKLFKFCIIKNMFDNSTYNVHSGNYTVSQIIKMIKKYKKNVKVKFINTKIMNRLSYHLDNKKIKSLGLNLNSSIQKDIKETLGLFKNLGN